MQILNLDNEHQDTRCVGGRSGEKGPIGRRVVILGGLGCSIRNYLCNPSFRPFLDAHEVHFWSPAWRELRQHKQLQNLVRFDELTRVRTGGFRVNMLSFVRAYYAYRFNSTNLISNLRRSRSARKNKPLSLLHVTALESWGRVASYLINPQFVERLERWCGATNPGLVKSYERRLRQLSPDLLVSTCPQNNYIEWPPVIAAHRLGIPLAVQVPSWDNLTSKGHFAAEFTRYLVWSSVMGQVLQRDYNVDHQRITHTGPPNFDFYFQSEFSEDRNSFARRHELDPDRPILLYGGVTPGLMPNDHEVCRIILDAIEKGTLPRAAQVLVRIHPKDPGDRWENLRRRYTGLRICVPNSSNGDVSAWVPDMLAIRDQVSCVRHANVHVNVASTLTLDACVVNRPTVNVAFDPFDSTFTRYAANYYSYEHYRPVIDLGAAALARSAEELISRLREYLEDESRDADKRATLVKMQLGETDGRAGERLAQALNHILLQGITDFQGKVAQPLSSKADTGSLSPAAYTSAPDMAARGTRIKPAEKTQT